MIIQTKVYNKLKFFRNQEPALLTKRDGSMYLVTGKRKKKLTLIKKAPECPVDSIQQPLL